MTAKTAGRYADETIFESTGDGIFTGFPYCSFLNATYSDTTDYCIGDVIGFSPSDSEMDCDYTGDENNFTFHCDYMGFAGGGTDCTFHYIADGTGSRSGDVLNFTVTWTIAMTGADCSGSCVITITGTSTRIGDPTCPTGKGSRLVSMIKLPELPKH